MDNCERYDQSGNCILCDPIYVLRFNQCFLYIEGCADIDENRAICLQCEPNFRLVQGICSGDVNCNQFRGAECTGCRVGFYLANGRCLRIPIENCLDFNGRRCLACVQNFTLVDNICQVSEDLFNGCSRREFPCRAC